jgi:hypothetical protein
MTSVCGYRRVDFLAAPVFRAPFAFFFFGPGFGFDVARFVPACEAGTSDSSSAS